MAKKFISIQEASELSGKSVQTIRRALKSGKLEFRRSKTPQGFIYSINRESVFEFYSIPSTESEVVHEEPAASAQATPFMQAPSPAANDHMEQLSQDFKSFTEYMERMVSQHSEERQNFMRLITTLQERIFVLENQLNLLKAPQKKWFHFW